MNNLSTVSTLPKSRPNASGLPGLATAPKIPGYGNSYYDNFRSLAGRAMADYGVNAAQVGTDYDLARQEAEQSLALSGLTKMADAQQNEEQLRNAYLGAVNPLLRGLFT